MKPILLKGHERAITQIKYNSEGDLIFTCSKDPVCNVWYSINGERLGTFNHQAAVWCVDCNWNSTNIVTGTGNMTLNLWDLEYGSLISKLQVDSSVRSANFSMSGDQIMFTTDSQYGKPWQIQVIDVRCPTHWDGTGENCIKFNYEEAPKPTTSLFGPLDQTLLTGHENGRVIKWDVRSEGQILNEIKDGLHTRQINDMQFSPDYTMFVTSSKDFTSKLFDVETFDHLKTYLTERPVNSASISPTRDHVVLGGGQEAMDVTTSAANAGKFEARFFHLIFEEEFARVKGHFGPINSLAFHPDGKSFASGAEDGYVRLNYFDPEYFEIVAEV